jgi:hypothetical protein
MKQHGKTQPVYERGSCLHVLNSNRTVEAALGHGYSWPARKIRRMRNNSAKEWFVMQVSPFATLAARYHCGGVE